VESCIALIKNGKGLLLPEFLEDYAQVIRVGLDGFEGHRKFRNGLKLCAAAHWFLSLRNSTDIQMASSFSIIQKPEKNFTPTKGAFRQCDSSSKTLFNGSKSPRLSLFTYENKYQENRLQNARRNGKNWFWKDPGIPLQWRQIFISRIPDPKLPKCGSWGKVPQEKALLEKANLPNSLIAFLRRSDKKLPRYFRKPRFVRKMP